MDLSVLLLVRRGEDLSKRKQGTSVTRGEELVCVRVLCMCTCMLAKCIPTHIHTYMYAHFVRSNYIMYYSKKKLHVRA